MPTAPPGSRPPNPPVMTLEQPMKTRQNVPKTSAIYAFMGSLLVLEPLRVQTVREPIKRVARRLRRRFRRAPGLVARAAETFARRNERSMAAIVTLRRGSETDIPSSWRPSASKAMANWSAAGTPTGISPRSATGAMPISSPRRRRAGRLRDPARLGVGRTGDAGQARRHRAAGAGYWHGDDAGAGREVFTDDRRLTACGSAPFRTMCVRAAPTRRPASRPKAWRAAAPSSRASIATSWSWRSCGRNGRPGCAAAEPIVTNAVPLFSMMR